jgi:hypothetical protein
MRCSNHLLPAVLALGVVSASGARGQAALGSEPSAPPGAPITGTAEKPWSNAIARAGEGRAVSTICQFLYGPKAPGWHDFAPLPPAVLGSSCQDGSDSAGVVVAVGHGRQY